MGYIGSLKAIEGHKEAIYEGLQAIKSIWRLVAWRLMKGIREPYSGP